EWCWILRPLRQDQPIFDAITVYTDAGRKSRRAVATWKDQHRWNHHLLEAEPRDSLQTLELLAVVWACTTFKRPLNVVTDSLYVAGVTQRIEDAAIKDVSNQRLYELLL
ncbi:PO113 protein, partial [Zapornia atra]|nr:PO113 protein [Zapornia atra]